MILTAYQPSYWPWPGVFRRAQQADMFLFCDTDRLTRKDFLTRNRIKTQSGEQWLTVPVQGSRDQRICDVQVETGNWRRKHLRTLELSYSKAPFWLHYREELEWLPARGRLSTVNLATMLWAMRSLEIETERVYASSLTIEGTGSEWIVDACREIGASEYLCGSEGRNYLDPDAFLKAGVKLRIDDYQPKRYPQLHGEFRPGLSVLDLLLNVGPAARRYL